MDNSKHFVFCEKCHASESWQHKLFILRDLFMSPKSKITELEKTLFRKTMKKVKPLSHTKKSMQTKPSVKLTTPSSLHLKDDYPEFSDQENLSPIKNNEYLQFSRAGIQHKILRKLKSGQYNVEAILDLHGETAIEAKKSLSIFLLKCQEKGIRHALIIHGKGKKTLYPILKNKVNLWLRQSEWVLAFCSAKPKDGFTGALYVLLKSTGV